MAIRSVNCFRCPTPFFQPLIPAPTTRCQWFRSIFEFPDRQKPMAQKSPFLRSRTQTRSILLTFALFPGTDGAEVFAQPPDSRTLMTPLFFSTPSYPHSSPMAWKYCPVPYPDLPNAYGAVVLRNPRPGHQLPDPYGSVVLIFAFTSQLTMALLYSSPARSPRCQWLCCTPASP